MLPVTSYHDIQTRVTRERQRIMVVGYVINMVGYEETSGYKDCTQVICHVIFVSQTDGWKGDVTQSYRVITVSVV